MMPERLRPDAAAPAGAGVGVSIDAVVTLIGPSYLAISRMPTLKTRIMIMMKARQTSTRLKE